MILNPAVSLTVATAGVWCVPGQVVATAALCSGEETEGRGGGDECKASGMREERRGSKSNQVKLCCAPSANHSFSDRMVHWKD